MLVPWHLTHARLVPHARIVPSHTHPSPLGGDEAISRRTRSKRPLGPAVELDPSELDRLLAEFDPDVQPLLDDDVYRQFLQVGGRRNPGHPVT